MASNSLDEECCNSGCNNCILDIRQRQHCIKPKCKNKLKINLFDGTYHQFTIISIETCTENVDKYQLQICSQNICAEKYMIEIPPTFHLIIRAPCVIENASKHDKNTKENYISRPYTPIRYNNDDLSFEVLVKYEPNGQMSSYFRTLQIGDETEWKGCYGDFIWSPNPLRFKNLVCICQGVAIAPIASLIYSILSNENDETIVYLLVCFKNFENYLLRSELVEFRKYWNFHSVVFFSQFIHNKKCGNRNMKNCPCTQSRLLHAETVCPYRLDQSELQHFFHERDPSSTFTILCGRNALGDLIKSCSIIDMKNVVFLQ